MHEQKKHADLAEQVKEPGGKGGLSLESAGRTADQIGKNREEEKSVNQSDLTTLEDSANAYAAEGLGDATSVQNKPANVMQSDLSTLEESVTASGLDPSKPSPTVSLGGAGATPGMGEVRGMPIDVTGEGITEGPGNPELTGGVNGQGLTTDGGPVASGEDWNRTRPCGAHLRTRGAKTNRQTFAA